MPPSSRDVGRTKARLLMSGRAWIAIAILASAAGLASFAEATPSGAAIHSSAKSAVCESFDTLSGDLASAPGSQIFKDVGNLGEVAGKSGSSRAVTQEGTELAALAKGSSLTEKQLVNATKAIASACGHALGVNVKTVAIPSSMQLVQPPAGTPGPETVPIPNGPALATTHNAATGTTVDGVQCNTGEQLVSHVHTHLTIFVNGQARVIPYGIGIPGSQAVSTKHGAFVETGSCFYWLHTHADDGVIHVESPSSQRVVHSRPVLRRMGHSAQHHAGRTGNRQGHRVLHRPGSGATPLRGQSPEPSAREPLPDTTRRRLTDRGPGPGDELGRSVVVRLRGEEPLAQLVIVSPTSTSA